MMSQAGRMESTKICEKQIGTHRCRGYLQLFHRYWAGVPDCDSTKAIAEPCGRRLGIQHCHTRALNSNRLLRRRIHHGSIFLQVHVFLSFHKVPPFTQRDGIKHALSWLVRP